MKGIILAGGSGTRLYPLSSVASKQLMPIYDKPMVYYPLSTLLLMDIKDILIISTPEDTPRFKRLLGSGKKLGLNFSYSIQESPKGIAEAFIIAKDFINNDNVTLILGDNLFYGHGYIEKIMNKIEGFSGALVMGYQVRDPERYGVIDFDDKGNVLSIEEKPKNPKSNYVVPGLYVYDKEVVSIVKKMKPSKRGELEITDLNKEYLKKGSLKVELLGRGVAWLDTGTHRSLLEAGMFIETIESRQGLKIGCIEEIAYKKGYISNNRFKELIQTYPKNEYRKYLEDII